MAERHWFPADACAKGDGDLCDGSAESPLHSTDMGRCLDLDQRRSWLGTLLIVFVVFARAAFEGLRIVMIVSLSVAKGRDMSRLIVGEAMSIAELVVIGTSTLHPACCLWISSILILALNAGTIIASPIFHLWGHVYAEEEAGYGCLTAYSVIAFLFVAQSVVIAGLMALPKNWSARCLVPFCGASVLLGHTELVGAPKDAVQV